MITNTSSDYARLKRLQYSSLSTAGSTTPDPTEIIASGLQPYDDNLYAIASLTGTSGVLKKTGVGTWVLDTNTYLTAVTSAEITSALGYTPVTNARTLTINGVTYDLTQDRSWTIAGGVTSFNTRTGAITLLSSDITSTIGYTPENAANKGIANGYASLDGSGLVPSTQLPSYVDDVLEYTNVAAFPATGTAGKIYVALDSNKVYRWSGSTYIEVSPTVGTIWGGITGTLSNQTDLQSALDAKVPTSRTITINGISYDLTANRSWSAIPAGGLEGQILAKSNDSDYNVAWIDNYAEQTKHDVKLGEAMSAGTAVYVTINGNGTNMTVLKASYAAEATSSKTLGIIQTGGILNDIVKVVTEGLLSGINTSTATAGDPVWLGSNGALLFGLANKPVAPNHLVYLGVVTRVHAQNGEIFVHVQNGFELDELHDISIVSKANNQGIFYESSTGLWKNKSIATVLGYTPYDASNPAGYITSAALSSYVPTSRTITINGTAYDLSADRSWSITSMIYPGAGIAVSTGTAWGTSITDNSANWNTAYSWGNHATAGYVPYTGATSAVDLGSNNLTTTGFVRGSTFTNAANPAISANLIIQSANNTAVIVLSNTNHVQAFSVQNTTGSPVFSVNTVVSGVSILGTGTFNNTVTATGFIKSGGTASQFLKANGTVDSNTYLTSYTETDPVFVASAAYGITATNITNWNTAYGWGNHASAGYLTSATAVTTYVPQTRTLTINGTTYDLSANRSWTVSGGSSALSGLTDVTITSVANGQLLQYSSASSKWVNWTPNYLTSYTETDTLASVTGRGNSTTSSITVAGLTVNTNPFNLNTYIKGAAAGFIINDNADTANNFGVTDSGNVRVYRGSLTIGSIVGTGTGTLYAGSIIKSGGTASQYLMADGSVSTLTNPITGTGSTNYVGKFNSASGLTSSQIYDDGTFVGIKTAAPGVSFEVNGATRVTGLETQSYILQTHTSTSGLVGQVVQPADVNNTTTSAVVYTGFISSVGGVASSSGGISLVGGSFYARPYGTSTGYVVATGVAGYAIRNNATDTSTNATNSLVGLLANVGHQTTLNAAAVTTNVTGVSNLIQAQAGTITNVYGQNITVNVSTGATTTASVGTFYGIRTAGNVGNAAGSGTGTLTTYYDIYLAGTTVNTSGTVTNKWGLYQANSAHTNYFAGKVLIGTTTIGAYTLDVTGTGRFTSDITGNSFIKSGGTSAQFLKADGSVDSTAYYAASNPSGYTTNTGTVTSVSGTGTVSGLTLTGTVTSLGSLTLGGTLSLTSGQVTTALGYTPYNSTNPNGYTTNTGTVTSVAGTGTVSGLTLTGTVTTSGSLTLGGTLSLTSGQVTTALGYTPYNSTNPNGYITSSGSISGNAATASSTTKVSTPDLRSTNLTPSYFGQGLNTAFMGNSTDGLSDGGTYHGIVQFQQWLDSSGGGAHQLGFTDNNSIWHRASSGGLTTWSSWVKLLNSGNYNSYAPTLTGGGASGTWGISITGSAASITGTYGGTLTSSQVTTALGYTPYNSTNPSGYTSNTGTVTSVSGTGTVSGLTLSGTVTTSGSLTLGGTLSLTSGNVTTALGFTPYNSTNPSGYITNTNGAYYVTAGEGNGVYFWQDATNYTIKMGVTAGTYQYGPVTDYSMRFTMGGGTGRGFVWGYAGSSPTMGLNANSGNLQIAGTFTEASSIRYKDNVADLTYTLEDVLKLRSVTYTKEGTHHVELGFIAEEVNDVIPEAVMKNEDGSVESISYGRLTAVLLNAVKDQQKQIEELKALLSK